MTDEWVRRPTSVKHAVALLRDSGMSLRWTPEGRKYEIMNDRGEVVGTERRLGNAYDLALELARK